MTAILDAAALLPGFADPVLGSQSVFRAVLDAMSRPGRPVACPEPLTAPAPLGRAMAAAALTLVDFDTPVWLDPALSTPAVQSFLRFHTGAPLAADPAGAAFLLVADAASLPRLGGLALGEDRYPDRSATLVVEVPALDGPEAGRFKGPGIATAEPARIAGLPAWFREDWAANGAAYPLGVDLLLTCGDRMLGLPRTTRWEG
ncbi:phosphonate C-P lyase system protein PhnH [Inquilinus sp. Marseille-Q2685]|uniref:phosphonate C-P lyase system protein PhnH n=1 Tax=Inquilinus sp. Marseille-Q2685 TaxID=2866581 RepID=UPI001CE43721|nr:phosphonate C-P lyase system protein PhnH [Inquilinus sp. Marseille-Q2685]